MEVCSPEDVLAQARAEGRDALTEPEVYALAGALGFDVPQHALIPVDPPEAPPPGLAALGEKGGGLVLKVVSAQILHKTELGGIRFVDGDWAKVREASREMLAEVARREPGARIEGVLAVERLEAVPGPAAETLLSVKQDPAFGTVLVFGLGGVLTEWFSRLASGASTVVLRPGRVEAGLERACRRSPAFQLLFERSRLYATPPLDLERTIARLEALAAFGERHGADAELVLEELEINPLLLSPGGRLWVVDGKGRLSVGRQQAQPRRPLHKIGRLVEPHSAAVIGASASGMNPGRIILRNLRSAEGIRYGSLTAVHPSAPHIDGVGCVPRVEDLKEKVDLAVVALPAEGARDAIRALAERDLADSIILIPGGFAETGNGRLEAEIVEALAASRERPGAGPVLVGGNCLGIVSKRRYNTFFLPQYKLPFHDAPGDALVAISQSGAYLVSLTSNLDGIVFPRASISFGNQMDLTAADLLGHFALDPQVKVAACYVEGFKPGDGRRFADIAERMRRDGRRVLVFKAGKTALGAEAARSHTASLAGDYAVARSVLESAGAIVTETLDMFEDYTKAFTLLFDRIPAGNRLGVVSNAGFECATVLDRLYNLVPARLAPETMQRLASSLPTIAHADNPVDATPMATTAQFCAAVEAMLGDAGVDAVLVSPIPATPALDNLAPDLTGGHRENIHAPGSLPQELLRLFRAARKPMAVCVDSGRLYDDFVTVLQRGGIPVYRKIDRASRALSALCTL
jgi:acyl-CoA synthetase (NDP forming)